MRRASGKGPRNGNETKQDRRPSGVDVTAVGWRKGLGKTGWDGWGWIEILGRLVVGAARCGM